MFPLEDFRIGMTRRHFCGRSGTTLGSAALASLLARDALAVSSTTPGTSQVAAGPHYFVPKAKRVVYLFQSGGPSLGAWASYGLGSEAEDLPAFVVLSSHGSGRDANQGLLERLWGSGFLPSSHQGVKLRGSGDPVLYLNNPPGIDRALRREMLNGLAKLNEQQLAQSGDPEIATRIAQYEMAFRMQASVPELIDFSSESAATFEAYGTEANTPGT